MEKSSWLKTAFLVFIVCTATAIASPAQTLTTLHSFAGAPDGYGPITALLQASDGNFYGTTAYGGTYNYGSVFRITMAGTLTTLHSFDVSDGSDPYAGLVQATDGNLYGTTISGGAYNYGTVFRITLAGTLTTLHSFDVTDGSGPMSAVMQATDGNLYGTTANGGAYGDGTIFKITLAGTLTTVHSFSGTDGLLPEAGLIQATDGNLYGVAPEGGTYGDGTIFKISLAGTLTTLHSFEGTDGSFPYTTLMQSPGGNLCGTTDEGGTYNLGTVFTITLAGTLRTLHSFAGPDGSTPSAGLLQATDGNFYGETYEGGANGDGTIFKITTAAVLTTLHSFAGTDGGGPDGGLVQGTDGNLYGATYGGGAYGDGTVFVLGVGLQPLTTLFSFDGTDGSDPYAGLVQGTDGNLYGTTLYGGPDNVGTIFKIATSGALTTLYSFCTQTYCTDGSSPEAGLVQATDGNLYGTTGSGGAYNYGTVFKITLAGILTTLHSFSETDGSGPAGLVQADDGNFYGITEYGGASSQGTVFRITPAGIFTTLHSFAGTDGDIPMALVQAADGNFYGTTYAGGASSNCNDVLPSGCGTVFKISPSGTLTTLHSFCIQSGCPDGSYPAGLVQASNGTFYGVTNLGGASSSCSYGCGTVFEITPSGTLTTLDSLNWGDGMYPASGLVQATDGNLYGVTTEGGGCECGMVFKTTLAGTITAIHSFDSTDGSGPHAGLVQATDGNLYGTTDSGGANGLGTVFQLTLGSMGPFVETVPTSGSVGGTVIILGTNLTGTTKVRFNATLATFTVVSASEITATVPSGATTGTVSVATPSGPLNSNVIFRVTPHIKTFTPTSGPVGTVVTITGVSLTQTSGVTFGGVKATSFTVVSDTEVQATVPTGAVTGAIAIVTAGGTATSSSTFTVN